ncbi:putative RNA polymerase II subunit B1 CTD phosphatase RPAP2 [Lampetra planeri]
MEAGRRTRSGGPSKTSKKDGKPVQTLSAVEEARRREVVKEQLRERIELDRRALCVVERLLEDSVPEDFLLDSAKFITTDYYKDAIEERNIVKLCGYPICPNKLGKIPTQQYKISTKTNKVYDITERKCFCSNFCYKASKEFELQISKTPLWLRQHESPPQIKLLKGGHGGSSGKEVCLSERRLQEDDIENIMATQHEDPHNLRLRSASAHLSHSSSSDSEQEQDFVSSVVSQQQGPRVHWGDVQEFPDENSPEIKLRMKGAGGSSGEEDSHNSELRLAADRINYSVCDVGEQEQEFVSQRQEPRWHCDKHIRVEDENEELGEMEGREKRNREKNPKEELRQQSQRAEEEDAVGRDDRRQTLACEKEVAGVVEPKQEAQELPEEASVEEVTVSMASCSVHAPSAALPVLTRPRQDLLAQTNDDSHQPGLNITQVGMSKRGAAGLRDLLKNHTTQTKPDSIRSCLLKSLRGTLKDWITDETQRFLHGALHLQGSGIPDVEEEQELDEDDLVDEVSVEDRGEVSPGERKQPSMAAPDYETLRVETKQLEIRVREFYKGSWILPEDQEELNGNKVGDGGLNPVLPLVDSHAQRIIQKRITVEKLTCCLRDIVGPLHLSLSDVITDLNNLVRTFRLTSTNIIHKTPEWTLISVVLLHMLSDVSPVVREALNTTTSVKYLNMLMEELGLQEQDLLSLVKLAKTPEH